MRFSLFSLLIDMLEQFQVIAAGLHIVFWSDFGGLAPDLVLRSMRLIAEEVLPHFAAQAN